MDRPTFPDDPALFTDFRDGRGDWDVDAEWGPQGMTVGAEGAPLVLRAPLEGSPAPSATLTEVVLSLEAGDGAAGAYCRGGADSRYELTLSTDGRLALVRVDGEETRELSGDDLPEGPRVGEPALLRLTCGTQRVDSLTVSVQLDASPVFTVTDPEPLPPAGDTGLVVNGDVEVLYESAAVWTAD